MKTLSIIIPLYNEEKIIPLLKERLAESLAKVSVPVEVVLVDDGSVDNTARLIEGWIAEDSRVVLIQLSRNFGHQAAITAGLQQAKGEAMVVMDGDLQDPPELISQLFDKWEQGFKVVFAARKSRQENFLRKIAFGLFYRVFEALADLPKGMTGVFGLMDRVVVKHLLSLEERNRFLPGLRHWVGFSQTTVWYDRQSRQGGTPKQSFKRLLKYGMDAIFSFSHKPLRMSFILGFLLSGCCFMYGLVLIILRIMQINMVSGFTTVAVAILFVGGVLLMSNGIMGEYLARIYDEVKARPLFIIAKKVYQDPQDHHVKSQDYL